MFLAGSGILLMGAGLGMLSSGKTLGTVLAGIFFVLAIGLVVIAAVVGGRQNAQPPRPRVNVLAFGEPKVRVRPRQRCPYCHDSLSGPTHKCVGCSAIYHDECLFEARGCATLGCAHAAPRRMVRH